MLFLENIKLALHAIHSNKMRSFLTMLGIIIGISSVISITSIGDSAQAVVEDEFSGFSQFMYVGINWSMIDDYISSDQLIYEEDVEGLKARFPDEIAYISMDTYGSSDTTIGRNTAKMNLSGINADYNKYDGSNIIIHGRGINASDVAGKRNVVVIDEEMALKLFNTSDAVGKTLPATILGESVDMNIVGVYRKEASVFAGLSTGESYLAYVPYNTLLIPGDGVSFLMIAAEGSSSQEEQASMFADYLTRIKDQEPGFYRAETAESQLGIINTVLGTISIAIGAIAAISLVVGGIGIMNIMLVSVTERTREIGIRKSLGARTKDILTQFLIEATILAVIGGIIGTALGIGIASAGMAIAGVGVVVNPVTVAGAVIFSALVGMFFGLFPARKAAKLDPIEALRYE